MSKESDRKEIVRTLHRMVASPFRAILGDGGGTVDVAGKTGYVWARKLGQEGTVFQAYNRGVSATNEGRVVLVQGSRVEGLPGYEVIGSAGGDYIDLSGHIATEPFDAHLSNPACRVYHNIDQNVAVGWVTLAFNSERFDTDAIHDTVTNNSRLTCKIAGIYQISATITFAASAVGNRGLAILYNGATMISLNVQPNSGAADGNAMTASVLYQLAANDYAEAQSYQASGGALAVLSMGNYTPEFMMVRVG